MSDNHEFAIIMGPVSRDILGEFGYVLNKHMSSASEERYGTHGSISVDIEKGVWADHEDQSGGGVLELLKAYKGFEKPEALEWLTERGYLKRRERANGKANGAANGEHKGKFAGFMDDHPIATYQYFDDKGRFAYEVLKFAKTAPRRFMQRRPHPAGGWIWGLRAGDYGKTRSGDWFKVKKDKHYEAEQHFEEATWFLYNLAEVRKAIAEGKPIVLLEGEKDCETAKAWGITATTNQGGAKNWHPELNQHLAGADIVICSDLDAAGKARTLLRGADLIGVAKTVRTLDMALHWKDAPEKADITDWKEKAGGTAEEFAKLVKRAPVWKPEAPKSRFNALQWQHLDEPGPELDFLIDGWLTEGERSVIGGPSRSGKSFLAIHAAMCVARGQDFFDFTVKRGGVVYQAGEGARGVKKRLKAYRKHFDVPDDEDVPFVFLGSKVDLYTKEGDTQALIDEIKGWALTMSVPLRMVVIDTLATATAGADENSGKDMSVVLANIARISDETGAHVMLVHHMNADGKKLRGHTSVFANVDQVITVLCNDATKVRTATLSKQKDDEDGLTLTFSLASVVVGHNSRTQRDVTSCIVLTVDEKEKLKKEQEQFGFSVKPSEERILIPLFKAIKKYGVFVATEKDGPAEAKGKHAVDFSYYLDVAADMDAGDDDKMKAKDRLRKAFESNNKFLLKAGVIGFSRPYVWWTGKPIRGFPHTFPEEMRNRKNLGETSEDSGKNLGNPISPGMAEMMDSDGELLL